MSAVEACHCERLLCGFGLSASAYICFTSLYSSSFVLVYHFNSLKHSYPRRRYNQHCVCAVCSEHIKAVYVCSMYMHDMHMSGHKANVSAIHQSHSDYVQHQRPCDVRAELTQPQRQRLISTFLFGSLSKRLDRVIFIYLSVTSTVCV